MLTESAFRRARRDWWEFFGNAWGALVGLAVALLIGFVALVWPGMGTDHQQFGVLGIGETLFAIGSFAFYWQRAPFRQRDEVRARIIALTSRGNQIEVFSSYPVLHREAGVPPFGDYILVSGLNIINHTDGDLDCTLDLEIWIDGEVALLQHIESREIVNAPISLPNGNRGNQQLTEQIKITRGARAVGFAAFSVDFLTPEQVQMGMLAIDRLTLSVTDAIHNVQLTEHEVWPWQWRDLLFGAAHETEDRA